MSLDSFFAAIDRAREELGCSRSGAWYRGVRHYKHRLYPSLLRPTQKISSTRERDIYQQYSNPLAKDEVLEANSWARLVQFQHWGVPTRLLDWTEVLSVALYIAVSRNDGAQPHAPAIWIINPFMIAKLTRGCDDKSIPDLHTDPDLDYELRFLKEGNWPFAAPMPFRPPRLIPRISAQRGHFTVHGLDKRPLDAIFRRHVRQVRLNPSLLDEARQFLERCGTDTYSLFPDLDGYAKWLHEKYDE